MTHSDAFQPLLFCDSESLSSRLAPALHFFPALRADWFVFLFLNASFERFLNIQLKSPPR